MNFIFFILKSIKERKFLGRLLLMNLKAGKMFVEQSNLILYNLVKIAHTAYI